MGRDADRHRGFDLSRLVALEEVLRSSSEGAIDFHPPASLEPNELQLDPLLAPTKTGDRVSHPAPLLASPVVSTLVGDVPTENGSNGTDHELQSWSREAHRNEGPDEETRPPVESTDGPNEPDQATASELPGPVDDAPAGVGHVDQVEAAEQVDTARQVDAAGQIDAARQVEDLDEFVGAEPIGELVEIVPDEQGVEPKEPEPLSVEKKAPDTAPEVDPSGSGQPEPELAFDRPPSSASQDANDSSQVELSAQVLKRVPDDGAEVPRRRLGYQPGLDGLRAISVIAVIFYHAGFEWIHGGFLGVEVFFVVSGFLITTLLIEENEANGRVDLLRFWIRRGRRLLPALFAMLFAVSMWVLVFGNAAQRADLRRNLPWSVLYVANWGQILGDVPYFQSGEPPLLRHLWSLAVEEQWYIVWPVAFIAVSRLRRSRSIVTVLLASVGVVMLTMWYIQNRSGFSDPTNVNYLSTITRSGGLLLGAAGAFFWRPWRTSKSLHVNGNRFDFVFTASLVGLAVSFLAFGLTEAWMYPWGLTLVSVLSLLCVMMIVHPAASAPRGLVDFPLLVAVGQRSYGLYLWHWPIFVLVGATGGSWKAFVIAAVITVPVSELCYRYVEQPIRSRTLDHSVLATPGRKAFAGFSIAMVMALTALAFRGVEPYDAAVGTQTVEFALTPTTAPGISTEVPASVTSTPTTPVDETAVSMPRVLLVGDSQGHSLAVNQPDGLESIIELSDGTLDGCSVYEEGTLTSAQGFELSTSSCAGWSDRWAASAQEHRPDIALVILGAWDSLDIVTDDQWFAFGSAERDAIFVNGVNQGLDAMSTSVGSMALLEVPCMRPVATDGAYTPPLPERADDARTAHINDLLRQISSTRDDTTFVEGPDQWCSDPAIADNTAYRWDGVHVYQLGAKLEFETIVPTLLDIAKTPSPAQN